MSVHGKGSQPSSILFDDWVIWVSVYSLLHFKNVLHILEFILNLFTSFYHLPSSTWPFFAVLPPCCQQGPQWNHQLLAWDGLRQQVRFSWGASMLCKWQRQPGFEIQVLQEWAYQWCQHAATFRHAENSKRCLWNRRALHPGAGAQTGQFVTLDCHILSLWFKAVIQFEILSSSVLQFQIVSTHSFWTGMRNVVQ